MIFDAFGLPFMSTALAALLIISLAAGPISMLVSLRGLEFLSEGIIHAVFPGIVIGYIAGGVASLYTGSLVAAALAATSLTLVARRGVVSGSAIAIILTSAFGVGVVIVSRESNYAGQLEQLLFGRVFTIPPGELFPLAAGVFLALGLVAATWRRQIHLAFDRPGAIAGGVRPLHTDLALNVAIALVVVAVSTTVGNLLALAVVILPGAVGRLVGNLIPASVVVATLFAASTAWLGLAAAFALSLGGATHLPGGATTVLTMVLSYLLIAAVKTGWDATRRPTRAADNR